MVTSLFTPVTFGAVELPNRIVMAPLTRMRAPGDVPNDLMREYYSQRASAGLIITEGTQISQQGKGNMDTPGIYTKAQVDGWSRITEAVHARGGRIAAQLWHVGRMSHPSLQDGQLPVSASALPFNARTTIRGEDGLPLRVECPTPRALTWSEISEIVQDYARAAVNARSAGFDMVEIHGAHGYLLHQFMCEASNDRTDQYGGSLQNRARLTLEVLDAVIDAWDAEHVGLRISPRGFHQGCVDEPGDEIGLMIATASAQRNIAFLHLSEPDWKGSAPITTEFRLQLRQAFPGAIIGAGNYSADKAQELIGAGLIDAAGFGRTFIANPDLPARIRSGAPLNAPVAETFYGGGYEGYTDYPTLNGAMEDSGSEAPPEVLRRHGSH
jgi:N-ethylmaleimide reductase